MAVNFGGFLIKAYGAYIRTDISGLLDITGTASGVIGMVGLAEKGPVNEPVTVTSYIQLVNTFGDGPLVRHALAAYVGGALENSLLNPPTTLVPILVAYLSSVTTPLRLENPITPTNSPR